MLGEVAIEGSMHSEHGFAFSGPNSRTVCSLLGCNLLNIQLHPLT